MTEQSRNLLVTMFTKNGWCFSGETAYQSDYYGRRAYRHYASCKPGMWAIKYFADGYQRNAVVDDFGELVDVGYTTDPAILFPSMK